MNPVTGYTMINFLEWLVLHHPEIQKLKNLSESKLIDLVNEFESGKLKDNDTLRRKWMIGFDYLFNDEGDWEGYGHARRKFETIMSDGSQSHWINLEILQNDLELILDNNLRIVIAVDSIDILQLCFPNYNYKNTHNQEEFIKQQISRMLIFYLTNSVYVKPIMLLPPYISELNAFYSMIFNFHELFTYGKYQRLLSQISKNAFISNSPDIAFLINPNCPPSGRKYAFFLKNFVSPIPDSILNEEHSGKRKLTELLVSINNSIRNRGNSDLELLVKDASTQKSNTLRCRRDAKAIRYIIELNKSLNASNIAIFLVSSSNWLKNLKETDSFKMAIEIKGINFKIIRDMDYFSTFLLEIEKLAEYHEKDFKINISDLKSIVSSDLANYRCQRKNKDFEFIPFF